MPMQSNAVAAKVRLLALALALLVGACAQKKETKVTDLLNAVGDRNAGEVRRLATAKIGLEQRNEIGATPLIEAAGSAQFEIAEILIDAGADVFAADEFGVTAGLFADRSKVSPNSAEGQARARVMEKMAVRGFPFPAPTSKAVKHLLDVHQWPPSRANQGDAGSGGH